MDESKNCRAPFHLLEPRDWEAKQFENPSMASLFCTLSAAKLPDLKLYYSMAVPNDFPSNTHDSNHQ
ncbi:unnamed protein product [Linum tenue]|uniref:Uncharacterized protein n=1 Tax=Linum tenue TaxID=586396 RepID=A0AAV0RLF7_9ROSI|nr:unnamed protein product [Linum tenue]